jgi:FAD synthase
MFDWKKPTVQMLGRWQPWHQGHQELFKRCVAKTGQVIIQVRDVQGSSGGVGQEDNPFDWETVCKNMLVPNIVNITYGRGVGYVFEEEVFEDSITNISATKIREKLRQDGELE